MGGEVGEKPAPHFLEALGQLARDRGRARPERFGQVGEGLGKAMGRLVE